MITTDFIYIFLNIVVLLIFVIVGQSINDKEYWKKSLWCILGFTLLLGLRLNRGNDYLHYIDVYKYDLESDQVLFGIINNALKAIDVGGHWIFLYYSLAFIIGAIVMLKEFRRYSKWLLPLFLISFINFSEYVIRQALGYTFIFLMVYYMLKDDVNLKKRVVRVLICLLAAYSIHSANLITGLIMIGVYIILKNPLPFKYTIPIYIFSSYFFASYFDLSRLNGILSFLGGINEKFSSYTDNSDKWFSEDSMIEGFMRKPIVKVFQTYGECSLIYLGYLLLKIKNDKKILFTYNFYVIGTIFTQCFYTLEILRRMGDVMYMWWAFPLAYVLSYKNILFQLEKNKKVLLRLCFIGLFFFAYDYLKYLFFRENDMYHFLWDMR